jgi:DNA-binding transcriptional regulator YbjK
MSRLTAKGEARRAAIVEAAARCVGTSGPDALTHRAVVAASGIPLAATTYYFTSIDDLRAAAVEALATTQRDAADALVATLPRRPRSAAATARHAVDVVLGAARDDAHLLALYESFLACGRHPGLREPMRRARARVDATLGELLDRCGRRAADVAVLVTLIDGVVISALVEGDGSARRRAEQAVARALA